MFLTGIVLVLHRYFVGDLMKADMVSNTLQTDKLECMASKRLK